MSARIEILPFGYLRVLVGYDPARKYFWFLDMTDICPKYLSFVALLICTISQEMCFKALVSWSLLCHPVVHNSKL